uniref:Uncharacterized protein n=1 Tax=Brassica campestris TaxID=3711 RepID=A0A3P6B6Y8_BRACM|nr:unnamed protein product [Brassica rapa]
MGRWVGAGGGAYEARRRATRGQQSQTGCSGWGVRVGQ